MTKNIPTEQLRALIVVAELRSYTKAAEFLGLSQPAISTQIKRLQEAVGCELVQKGTSGVTLTPKGELALHYARQIIALHDQVILEMRPMPAIRRLMIGIPSDCIDSMLASALIEFRSQTPSPQVRSRRRRTQDQAAEGDHPGRVAGYGLCDCGLSGGRSPRTPHDP